MGKIGGGGEGKFGGRGVGSLGDMGYTCTLKMIGVGGYVPLFGEYPLNFERVAIIGVVRVQSFAP